ncbi:IS110 family transposase [Parasphingorhabdus sp.]|uniref:IS110 family transposase n=1 Tax=Parasphingorhabdus sp. TaxID=2709688 RepID=UPI0030A5A886
MSKLPTNLSSVTTVAVDLAKHVFQVHGCDAAGRVLVAKALRRKDVLPFFVSLGPCLIGMEACASAHHWGRELIALGHEVKLIPPTYVKPFVKRQKNDKNDAAAIYEAMLRPGLRFVAVRSIDNQALLMEHKVREMLVQQRTQLLNGLRGHLAEIGVIAAQGTCNMRALGSLIHEGHSDIPEVVRHSLIPLVTQITHLDEAIKAIDSDIAVQAKADPVSNRLMTIPGIGPVTATALVATVGDPARFSGPREFAAFLGLVPRQNSSGGKARLGPITKMGNRYLRKLLVVGAHAVLHHHAKHNDPLRNWARKLLETKPFKLVAVATANKLARIAFALMSQNTRYQAA